MKVRLDRGNVVEETSTASSKVLREEAKANLYEVLQQPFVRVLPNGSQMSLGRDALAVLRRPAGLHWVPEDGAIKLVAADKNDKTAFTVTYSAYRSSGIISVPRPYQNLLSVGKYEVRSWAVDEAPVWLKFRLTPEPVGIINENARGR